MGKIDFTAADWARIRRDWTAWWRHELQRPLLYLSNVTKDGKPRKAKGFHGFLSSFPPGVTPAEVVEKYVAYESQRVYRGDTYPFWFVNFGPGILAGPLGAKVNATKETVWFDPPAGASLAKLRMKMDRDDYWWQRILAITKTAVEMIGDTAQISYTDLGGNLDILASLIGTESLLFELIDHPDKVAKAVAEITKSWIVAYDELDSIIRPKSPGTHSWASVWAPGTTYIMQCDFSYMISPDMFKRFVMPDLEACSNHIEYPFYHLDGVGEIPHLDHLLSIKNLRGIQWIQGDGKPTPEHWPDLYRRILRAGKLIQINVTREGARRICREVGGKGFIFTVHDEMSAKEADKFVAEMDSICG
jgi:5-methyltetrahydrofolate--homocysteine methyltransferase